MEKYGLLHNNLRIQWLTCRTVSTSAELLFFIVNKILVGASDVAVNNRS